MLNELSLPPENRDQRNFNILISEKETSYREYLAKLIKSNRSAYNVFTSIKMERVFDFIYSDIEIDIVFFDVEVEKNSSNLAILRRIKPNIRLINWSNCRHPEVIEYLYYLGIKTFCLKDSDHHVIFNAIDYINNNQNILYLDKKLNNCLYLLKS